MEEKKGFGRHFTREMLRMDHPDPSRFVHGPWRQRRRVPLPHLAYRLIMCPILFATTIWSIAKHFKDGRWFIYLTNWGYLMLAAHMVLSAYLVLQAYVKERKQTQDTAETDSLNNQPMPKSYKIYWALYNISIPSAIFITIIYWSFIYNPEFVEDEALDIIFHAGNAVFAIAEIFIGGPPSRLLHCVQPLLFGVVYLAFNVVYCLAGGTDSRGNNYIYIILNWEKPSSAVITTVGCAAFLLIVSILVTILAGLRSRIAKKLKKNSHSAPKFQPEPLGVGSFNKAFVNDVV